MSIEKPVIGQPGWGLVLNAALDELDEKETIDGAEAKATQAYQSGVEYTDARINELEVLVSPISSVAGRTGAVVLTGADVGLSNETLMILSRAARNPDLLIAGAITRDASGAATSASVVWPDGTAGTYTADTVSTAFPGAVDAYHITYGSPATKTFTQPAVTRDSTGAVTNLPALVVT